MASKEFVCTRFRCFICPVRSAEHDELTASHQEEKRNIYESGRQDRNLRGSETDDTLSCRGNSPQLVSRLHICYNRRLEDGDRVLDSALT